jgi:hypothetical protein
VAASGEEHDVELLLEQRDLLADRGLADPAAGRGRAERTGLHGGEEVARPLHPHRLTIKEKAFIGERCTRLPQDADGRAWSFPTPR